MPQALSPVAMLPSAADHHIEFPSIQSHVRIGQPGLKRGDADYFPLLVGNHVLGGAVGRAAEESADALQEQPRAEIRHG